MDGGNSDWRNRSQTLEMEGVTKEVICIISCYVTPSNVAHIWTGHPEISSPPGFLLYPAMRHNTVLNQAFTMKPLMPHDPATVLAATQRWLERAVIGLNLCPFAKAVYIKQQIHYIVSAATEPEQVLDELDAALHALADADPARIDTALLILPGALSDFAEYNDFLNLADRLLAACRLQGVLQIASFHPHFQFQGSDAGDIENATNRSPYPMLHLLREASVSKAVAAFPEAASIYERNQETLRQLGHDGWRRLMSGRLDT